MLEKKLHKKLKSDPRFIPYNDKYDFDYVLSYLKKTVKSKTGSYLEYNALNSFFF